MKKHKESNRTALENRAREVFDDSVADLDGATRSRLTQARHRALRALERPGVMPQWYVARPQIVAGAVAVVAVGVVWLLAPDGASVVPVEGVAEVSDFELLLGEDDLDLIEELEFYAWLEGQPEFGADGEDGDG
jgi:hypothetical protein